MNLDENELEYQVLVEGKVLAKRDSQSLAEIFLAGLDKTVQGKAVIVPVTKGGKQFLLG